jgi:hypothetical protein
MSIVSLLALSAMLVSCLYRMPDEGEYTMVPTTNNPDVVRERPGSLMSGGSY